MSWLDVTEMERITWSDYEHNLGYVIFSLVYYLFACSLGGSQLNHYRGYANILLLSHILSPNLIDFGGIQ